MTELEEAVERNLDLHAQLKWQLDQLRGVGQWNEARTAALSLDLTQQRLETLIDFVFDPQDEISKEAFELAWEERHGEYLNECLSHARKILFMPSATGEVDG